MVDERLNTLPVCKQCGCHPELDQWFGDEVELPDGDCIVLTRKCITCRDGCIDPEANGLLFDLDGTGFEEVVAQWAKLNGE